MGQTGDSEASRSRRLKIAFVGVSHSHGAAKVKVVQSNLRYELAGVFDQSAEALEPYRRSGVPILTRDQILDDRGIELVAVESEVKDHARDARQALEAGKHVHVEKPPADTLAEFRDLVSTAERKHLLLQPGYMWRYNPGIRVALEAARNGWLGHVYLVRASMNTLITEEQRKQWAVFRGGQMFEQGSHLIDILVRLMGKPARVTPFLRKDGIPSSGEAAAVPREYQDNLMDNTAAVLEWNRALGLVTAAVLQPNANPYRFLEILGENGTAVVRPIEPPGLTVDLVNSAGPYRSGRQEVVLPPYRRYVDDFEELARAVTERRPLEVTFAQELAVQETILQASGMS